MCTSRGPLESLVGQGTRSVGSGQHVPLEPDHFSRPTEPSRQWGGWDGDRQAERRSAGGQGRLCAAALGFLSPGPFGKFSAVSSQHLSILHLDSTVALATRVFSLSVSLCVSLSLCLSYVCKYVYLSTYLYPSVHLSIHLPIFYLYPSIFIESRLWWLAVDMGRDSATAQGQRPGPEGGACWEGWEGGLGAGLWLFSTTAGPWLSGWSVAGPGHRSCLWHRPWERDPTSRAGQAAGGLMAQRCPIWVALVLSSCSTPAGM